MASPGKQALDSDYSDPAIDPSSLLLKRFEAVATRNASRQAIVDDGVVTDYQSLIRTTSIFSVALSRLHARLQCPLLLDGELSTDFIALCLAALQTQVPVVLPGGVDFLTAGFVPMGNSSMDPASTANTTAPDNKPETDCRGIARPSQYIQVVAATPIPSEPVSDSLFCLTFDQLKDYADAGRDESARRPSDSAIQTIDRAIQHFLESRHASNVSSSSVARVTLPIASSRDTTLTAASTTLATGNYHYADTLASFDMLESIDKLALSHDLNSSSRVLFCRSGLERHCLLHLLAPCFLGAEMVIASPDVSSTYFGLSGLLLENSLTHISIYEPDWNEWCSWLQANGGSWPAALLPVFHDRSNLQLSKTLDSPTVLPSNSEESSLLSAKPIRIAHAGGAFEASRQKRAGNRAMLHSIEDDNFLVDIFRTAVAHPDAIAVSNDQEYLTYSELIRQVSALTKYLVEQSFVDSSPLGICLPRGSMLIVTLLAVQVAGLSYVPIDPDFPAERTRLILQDAGAQALLTSSAIEGLQIADDMHCIQLDRQWQQILSRQTELPTAHDWCLASGRSAARCSYVIYTSGSTGRPKGVCVSMANLTNFLRSMRHTPGVESRDTVLALTTVAFDIAQLELLLPLMCGGTVCIAPRDVAVDGNELAAFIQRHKVSVLQATPSTWRLLKAAGWRGKPNLKALAGGEPLNDELAGWILERVECLWNMYGPTETTVWSTCCAVSWSDVRAGRVPIGKAIDNTRLYIAVDDNADSEGGDVALRLCAQGEQGELLIGGDGVALGYYQRPDLSATNFIDNPFSQTAAIASAAVAACDQMPGDANKVSDPVLYRTGDLVSLDSQGHYHCHGRIDNQIKLRGYRIEPGEIEALLESAAEIDAAAIHVHEHAGSDLLVGYLVVAQSLGVSLASIMQGVSEQLANRLPEYMLPQVYVRLAQMPLTPNAKLDRNALPDPWQNQLEIIPVSKKTDGTLSSGSDDQCAGFSLVEKRIASMWGELIGQPVVDRQSNFFDLGGHSLLAMKFITDARQTFSISVPFRNMATDTLAQLALRFDRGANSLTTVARSAVPLELTEKSERSGGFINKGRRSVYYQLHTPLTQPVTGAVLLVPPLAQEQLRSYREYFTLAETLAQQGLVTLRFDFSGSGHSGLMSEEISLQDWLDDINDAASFLCNAAGTTKCDVVSLRAGSLLMANALLDESFAAIVKRQVIWDPVFNGATFVQSLKKMTQGVMGNLDRFRWPLRKRETRELMGQVYSAQLLTDLQALRWPALAQTPATDVCHCLSGRDLREQPDVPADLIAKLEGHGKSPSTSTSTSTSNSKWQLHRLDQAILWNDMTTPEAIIVAPQIMNRIVGLLV